MSEVQAQKIVARAADLGVDAGAGQEPVVFSRDDLSAAQVEWASLRVAKLSWIQDLSAYREHWRHAGVDTALLYPQPVTLKSTGSHASAAWQPWLWLHAQLADEDEHLVAAMADLDDVVAEAGDEGFEAPATLAVDNARRLLRSVHGYRPAPIDVYPTQERDVAIYASGGYRRSVLVLCESDGGALCLVNLNGSHRRATYSSADMLPDGFLREGLAAIDGP